MENTGPPPRPPAFTPAQMAMYRHLFRQNRDYDEKGVNETLAAFMALPEAPGKAQTWAIHLQQSTESLTTGDESDLEIAVYTQGMLEPAVFPCDGQKLQRTSVTCYLLSVILNAFSKEENREILLSLHKEKMDYQISPSRGETMDAFIARSKREEKELAPPGLLPNGKYGLFRRGDRREGEKLKGTIYRPTQILVLDLCIQQNLQHQSDVFGLGLRTFPVFELASGFAAADGISPRGDVTFCAYYGCRSLSTKHRRCLGCLTAWYCGREHQKEDWPVHKKNCRLLKSASEEWQRETGGVFDAKDEPNIVWLERDDSQD